MPRGRTDSERGRREGERDQGGEFRRRRARNSEQRGQRTPASRLAASWSRWTFPFFGGKVVEMLEARRRMRQRRRPDGGTWTKVSLKEAEVLPVPCAQLNPTSKALLQNLPSFGCTDWEDDESAEGDGDGVVVVVVVVVVVRRREGYSPRR